METICLSLVRLQRLLLRTLERDFRESVHLGMIMKATNKMQLHRLIYYS